jgi:hypothetical protein
MRRFSSTTEEYAFRILILGRLSSITFELKKIKLAVGMGEDDGRRSMIFLGHGSGLKPNDNLFAGLKLQDWNYQKKKSFKTGEAKCYWPKKWTRRSLHQIKHHI